MPEFYFGSACKYQPKAQPYLDAIAHAVRDDKASIAFLLKGTKFAQDYLNFEPLCQEQWNKRDPQRKMICPFWSNYWYEPCPDCNCRTHDSVSMEIDAIFFLQSLGRTLAIHVEMKGDGEGESSPGQFHAYRPRAACYQRGGKPRNKLNEHQDYITVLLCGDGSDIRYAEPYFDRVISHETARQVFLNYPKR